MDSDSLRLLLVSADAPRADQILSRLASSLHSFIVVPTLGEAAEALSIQKFDAVLLESVSPSGNLASFAAVLQNIGRASGSRTFFISCSPETSGHPEVAGALSENFDGIELAELVRQLLAEAPQTSDIGETNASSLAIFEPEAFEEQCAGEKELMVEIVDLFFAECETELPAMGEALNDFGSLSRLAHTLKGSLGALHAPLARKRAEGLELAAKEANTFLCAQMLDALEHDVDNLLIHLSAFRKACSSS